MARGGGCGNADTERAPVRGRQSILPRMRIEKFCLGNRAGSALPPLPAHSPLPLRKHAAKESLPCNLVLMRATRVYCLEGMFAHQWRAHYSHPCALHGAFSLVLWVLSPSSLPPFFLQPVCARVEGGASGSDTDVGEHMAGRAPAPHASCRQQSPQDAGAAK
jgi:hypothetical protein